MDGLGWKKSSIIISVMTHLTIAYWCVLVAIILPIIWIGFAKAGTRNYIHEHNSAPRELLNTLTGFRKRAVWAQQNAGARKFPPKWGIIISLSRSLLREKIVPVWK